jgi:hypothetical protein
MLIQICSGFCCRKLAGQETEPRDGDGVPAKEGVTDEPRLAIAGQNFDPDLLFVKVLDDGLGNITTDCKYIDIKYLDDVPYNPGGQTAIKNAMATGNANVTNTTGVNLIDIATGVQIPNTNGQLTITSVEKLSVRISDLDLIIF